MGSGSDKPDPNRSLRGCNYRMSAAKVAGAAVDCSSAAFEAGSTAAAGSD